jgi:hypothetical protein
VPKTRERQTTLCCPCDHRHGILRSYGFDGDQVVQIFVLAAPLLALPLNAQSATKSATVRMGGPAAQIQAQRDGFDFDDPMVTQSSVAGAYAKIPVSAGAGAGRKDDGNAQTVDPVAVGNAAGNEPPPPRMR